MSELPQRQLYTALRDLQLPDCVRAYVDGGRTIYQRISCTAFVRWPDGKPCLAVNMYLLDRAHAWTGDSAITYASFLSELIRHCARYRKGFGELTDSDIFVLVDKLRSDRMMHDNCARVRNDNTTREIIRCCLGFLDWFQTNLHHSGVPLIGERSDSPAIVAERKRNPHNGRYFWEHRYARLGNSTEPKPPIGLSIIEDIEAVIDRLGDPDVYPEPAKRRLARHPEMLDALIDYMYERRAFMVWIMKRVGLRPEEMARMPLKENGRADQDLVLVLLTMKRRKLDPPPRRFEITAKDGRAVRRYLSARAKWAASCAAFDPTYVEASSMFLGTESGKYGAAIGKAALAKDFEKLCNLAGYRDQQTCFSMFRHRFITYEVLAHLKHWEATKGPITSEQDLIAVLERVRIKTGHRNAKSLLHYVDLARDMEGVWTNVERNVGRLHAAEHLKSDLERLLREFRRNSVTKMATSQVVGFVVGRLEQIVREARDAGVADATLGGELLPSAQQTTVQ